MKKPMFRYLLFAFIVFISGCGTSTVNVDAESIEPIFNSIKYSRLSSGELIEKLGEPSSKEEWSNNTPNGDVLLTTYAYDISENHFEFIVADDSVVRVSIYSNAYWNNNGEHFIYNNKDKSDLRYLFGISEIKDTAKIKDSNVNYEISPVSDTVANFFVGEISEKDKTFGCAKITYNIKYFD